MPRRREQKEIIRGKDLIEWIRENEAEDHVLIAVNHKKHTDYMDVVDVWEGESHGGAIMLDVEDESDRITPPPVEE